MTDLDRLREQLRARTLADEPGDPLRLAERAALDADDQAAIVRRAIELIRQVRASSQPSMMESFLAEYGLSTDEGVALMCLAEAMLRVPDAQTLDELIQDKIVPHDWGAHVGDSGSILVNASTWALMLTGQMLEEEPDGGIVAALRGALRRLGEPLVRVAVARAMRELGAQFVLGRDIEEAISNGESMRERGYTYSYDMLGEAARTEADAARYLGAYAQAIAAISASARSDRIALNPGISVKLSALHPRYEPLQRDRVLPALTARLAQLARAAGQARLGLNIDAEEAERLDLSLDIVEALLRDPSLAGWDGLGVVVQAYGPRAEPLLDWLYALAGTLDRRLMVRLVKGAYWDYEIKHAQVMGLEGFPVYTRKVHTDVSYMGCARKLLSMRDRIYPQFATHNAHTMAAVLHMAGDDHDGFEFQRLHGMGERLHEVVQGAGRIGCRIYAPVGPHRDLLAYLVRRLLENGANSSFVHQIVDARVSAEHIARDPLAVLDQHGGAPATAIASPARLFGATRANSRGVDVGDPRCLAVLESARAPFAKPYVWSAAPLLGARSEASSEAARPARSSRIVVNPAATDERVGSVEDAVDVDIEQALCVAVQARDAWFARDASERAAILRRAADLYESHRGEVLALTAREAGKTLIDGIAELREAVDFLRYYAALIEQESETSLAATRARGVIVCISPWNFPLAIFTGQVAAALVTGNVVIAKPAEQSTLIAARAVSWLHRAGVPTEVLQLLPGDGPSVGAKLVADPRIAGVCFTGSIEVARHIERQLAQSAPQAMLIAETGGINAMLVDSTALPEQAVRDVLTSAFQSAGQRCSAARILYVQREVEGRVLEMLVGAMQTLVVGDPWRFETDVGPVIDDDARDALEACCGAAAEQGRLIECLPLPADVGAGAGRFVAPTLVRVAGIEQMDSEVFGPVLHVARFDAERIDAVLDAINARGFGLTLGVHSRIDSRVQTVVERARVGNLYVNRNQIGAVVGSQPFGGEGLSGTGPKAGGPHYLRRFRICNATHGDSPPRRRPAAGQPPSAIGAAQLEPVLDRLRGSAKTEPERDWAVRGDRISVLRGALRGRAAAAMAAAAAIDCGPVDLPGPTGESNRYRLAPRGVVLCLGPGAEQLLEQAVQALCMGNRVLAVAPDAAQALEPLVAAGLPVLAVDGTLDDDALQALDVAVVACLDRIAERRRALAERDGPIVPLVSERFNPTAYAHERVVSIDTTAAGGNATLLARGE